MALRIVIAKNQTASPILLSRLGLTVPASGNLTITNFASFYEVQAEPALQTPVTSGDIILNNGSEDLSVAQGLSYLNNVFLADNGESTSGEAVSSQDDRVNRSALTFSGWS
jgi:hypothetical protein